MSLLNVNVKGLGKKNAEAFEAAARAIDGVVRVDAYPGRAEMRLRNAQSAPAVLASLRGAGFDVEVHADVRIDGMTCRACEITIERRFRKIDGIKSADVDAAKGVARVVTDGRPLDLEALQEAVAKDGYAVEGSGAAAAAGRPGALRLLGLFGTVFLLGALLSKLGIGTAYDTSGTAGFLSALMIGVVAGSSSCMAVSGGLLLSATSTFRKTYGNASPMRKMQPVFMFVAGRIASYGILGGGIGLAGRALTPSPFITGAITVTAAVFMLIMGLDMLKIAPRWLLGLLPRMPKALSHRIIDSGGKVHPTMPFLLGAATFFIPCGFTQSFQLYALSSGSFAAGAVVLAGFAIGTSPALLALGWASHALKGKAGALFFQFSGALVVVLGLWNVQNGFTVAGHPLTLPSLALPAGQATAKAAAADDPNVVFDGKVQIIKMKLGADPSYLPSDEFTVRAGYPVRMEIEGIGTGCRSIFQIPKFKASIALNKPLNVLEFTPDKTGDASFSCSMGMFRGTLHVVKS